MSNIIYQIYPIFNRKKQKYVQILKNLQKWEKTMIKVAIICEFNPFHNGHKLLFERVRAHFAPESVCIVCIMSGKGFKKNHILTRPTDITDIAPTLCYAAGFSQPKDATGGIVFAAFDDEN